ncbi:MAG: alpha/beta hydrolase [Planctomycetota bacterium]
MRELEPLWPEAPADDPRQAVTLRWMPVARAKSACVVLPGGAYRMHADHEAERIGTWLNTLGVSAAVVRYRVAPNRHPAPLTDAAEAMRQVRHRVGDMPVGVIGFSAGGHLGSTLSNHYADTEPGDLARPDYAILCYPVIHLLTAAAHLGSRQHLLADTQTPELLTKLSNEKHVTERTPPTFLWHTAEDAGVLPVHSLMYASALAEKGVPFEVHVFERGRHGLGLCEGADMPAEVREWSALCGRWLVVHGWADRAVAEP